jgi:hypothetical protein
MLRHSLFLALAAALAVLPSLSAAAEPPRPAGQGAKFAGFPILPPIPTADPSVRHEEVFRLPTRLQVRRTDDQLSVGIDPGSLEPVKVRVGKDMVTGLKQQTSIFLAGKSVVSGYGGLQGWGAGTALGPVGGLFNRRTDKVPRPGEGYTAEVRLTLFETDIPAQHMWSPEGGKYRVLWARTLRQEVGPEPAGLPVGRWTVEFTNGVVERCEVRKDGTAAVVEPRRTTEGKAVVQGGSVVMTYQDDRVERWTPVGRRMVVEHWYPGARFPCAAPVLGIAERPR